MSKNTKAEKKTVQEDGSIIATLFSLDDTDDKQKSKNKPGKVSYDLIRKLRVANSLISVCVNTQKHTITKIPGFFKLKQQYEDKDINVDNQISYLEFLRSQPNPQYSGRSLWLQVMEDVLTIDRGVVEIVRNSNRDIVQLWAVDGATIRPRIDENGLLGSPAYVQKIPGKTKAVAKFEADELVVLMNNPSTELNMAGYSYSPIEQVLSTVVAYVNADAYNAGQLTMNQIPPFIATLTGASNEEVVKLQQEFSKREGKNFKGLITNADNMKFQNMKPSNQDMQFYEFMLWLARITISAFGMSPQDLGLTMDINKATGDSQREISKNQGILDLLDLRKEFWDKIISLMAQKDSFYNYIEYENEPIDQIDEKVQAEIHNMYLQTGVLLADEVRQALGRDPLEQEESETAEEVEEEDLEEKVTEILKSMDKKYEIWYG